MKKPNERANALIKKVVAAVVDRETYDWPPQCAFLLYQPKRPVNTRQSKKK